MKSWFGHAIVWFLCQRWSVDELENTLHCHVDVVTTGIEDKRFLSAIMQEGVLLYVDEGNVEWIKKELLIGKYWLYEMAVGEIW